MDPYLPTSLGRLPVLSSFAADPCFVFSLLLLPQRPLSSHSFLPLSPRRRLRPTEFRGGSSMPPCGKCHFDVTTDEIHDGCVLRPGLSFALKGSNSPGNLLLEGRS